MALTDYLPRQGERHIAREVRTNELPHIYPDWLKFYDALPEDLRAEPVVRMVETFSPEGYAIIYGKRPFKETEVEIVIDRDFYLARAAELLLPVRPTLREVDHALRQVHESRDIDTQGTAVLLLRQLGEVACRK